MKLPIKTITTALSILILALIAYYAISSLSESNRFSKYTLDYFLLTPSIIKSQPIDDARNESYYYSAADGNKPLIISVTFFSKKNSESVNNIFSDYLQQHDYEPINSTTFRNENKEALLEYDYNESNDLIVTFSLIEHIK